MLLMLLPGDKIGEIKPYLVEKTRVADCKIRIDFLIEKEERPPNVDKLFR